MHQAVYWLIFVILLSAISHYKSFVIFRLVILKQLEINPFHSYVTNYNFVCNFVLRAMIVFSSCEVLSIQQGNKSLVLNNFYMLSLNFKLAI